MSRAPGFRGALWIAIVGSAVHSGCIHNHYYGTTASLGGCPPAGATVTAQVGDVCDVPQGQVVVSNPSGSRAISSAVSPPSSPSAPISPNTNTGSAATMGQSRVVISQPAYGPPSLGQRGSRIKWRKPDPESLPTMQAEGGLDNPIIR